VPRRARIATSEHVAHLLEVVADLPDRELGRLGLEIERRFDWQMPVVVVLDLEDWTVLTLESVEGKIDGSTEIGQR